MAGGHDVSAGRWHDDVAISTDVVIRRLTLRPQPAAPVSVFSSVQGPVVQRLVGGGIECPHGALPARRGLRARLTDIFGGLDVGLQTSFAASGVPPGTYFVRVRAGNDTGISAPSNEVVVTVP